MATVSSKPLVGQAQCPHCHRTMMAGLNTRVQCVWCRQSFSSSSPPPAVYEAEILDDAAASAFPRLAIWMIVGFGLLALALITVFILAAAMQVNASSATKSSTGSGSVVTEAEIQRMAKTPTTKEFEALAGKQLTGYPFKVSYMGVPGRFSLFQTAENSHYTVNEAGKGLPNLVVGTHITQAQADDIQQKLSAGIEVRVRVHAVIVQGFSSFEKPHIDINGNFQVVGIE